VIDWLSPLVESKGGGGWMRSEREHGEPWTRRVRERKEEKVAEGE